MNDEEQRNELVQRATAGDEDALQRLLVDYHGPLLAAVARRMEAPMQRYFAPEDILQEAYTDAFKSISRCRFAGPAPFYCWLERIALDRLKNAARDLQRDRRDIRRNRSRGVSSKSSQPDIVERLPGALSTPSRHLARHEASAAALSSLARLPEDYRKVLRMRFLQDRPVAEIAAELGKTTGAVHMIIKRALDKLEALMGSISRYRSPT